MKALDTNAVVRFVVRDDEKQSAAVRRTLLEAEKNGETLFLSGLVILETIWVLSSVYECTKEDILRAMQDLLMLSVLTIQDHECIVKVCQSGESSNIDLADLFIGLTAKHAGCETTLTLDKKAAKSELFTLLN